MSARHGYRVRGSRRARPDARGGGGALRGPVVHGVAARRVHVHLAVRPHHRGQPVLHLPAAQVPPRRPGAAGLPDAGADPLIGVAHEQVDAAVGRRDRDGDADPPAPVRVGALGVAEPRPRLEAAAGRALLQRHDLPRVGPAQPLQGREPQREQQQPAVVQHRRAQRRRQRAAAQVGRLAERPVRGLAPAHHPHPEHPVRRQPPVRRLGQREPGAGVAVVRGTDPVLAVGQRLVAADVVVAAAGRVAALPLRGAAVGHQVRGFGPQDGGREVVRPVVVVVAAVGDRGERRRPVRRVRPRPAGQRGPGEGGDGGVVGVVGVAGLLAVADPGEPVAELDVRIGVQRVHEGGPIVREQPDEDVEQLLVVVRPHGPQR